MSIAVEPMARHSQKRHRRQRKHVEWDGSKRGNTPYSEVSRRRFCLGDPHFSKFVVVRKSHGCHSLPQCSSEGGGSGDCIHIVSLHWRQWIEVLLLALPQITLYTYYADHLSTLLLLLTWNHFCQMFITHYFTQVKLMLT